MKRCGPALALFFLLLAVYLVTYSPRFHSSDGMAMFAMADSLVKRGDTDIDSIRWMGLQQGTYGVDGHLYSRKGPGMSILLLPLVWLGSNIPIFGPATTALLFNSLVTAAAAVCLYLVVTRLGSSQRKALVAGMLFGLATPAWPYAKTCFSDPLAGLCLVVALLLLTKFARTGRLPWATAAGTALAISVSTRYANLLLVAPFACLLLWYTWRRRCFDTSIEARPQVAAKAFGCLWRPLAAFCAPLVLVGLLLIGYNVARYGNAFDTGYLAEESFSGNWWFGMFGLLFSPGRGLFLYAPILLLALPCFPSAIRRYPAEAWLSLAVVLIHVLLYGKWFMWHGGYAWGPRFVVPAIPFLVLLGMPAFDWLRRSLWRVPAYLLAAVSVCVQIVGLSVHFELFLNQLLTTSLPLFAPETFLLPRYSPLIGQLSYLTPQNLDFGWIVAGRVQWVLLAVLGAVVTLACLPLIRFLRSPETHASVTRNCVAPVAVVLAAVCLLAFVHRQYPADLQASAAELSAHSSPSDLILTGSPADSIPLAELYRGHSDVVGLNAGTLDRDPPSRQVLDMVPGSYARVWWLPGWASQSRSDVELRLAQTAFQVGRWFFPQEPGSDKGRVVTLFYFSQCPMEQAAIGATFGGVIRLRGAQFDRRALDEHRILPVVLEWEPEVPLAEDYSVFVQLLDQAGNRVAGADSQPAGGARPTSSWEPSEVIADRHAFSLPETAVPGPFDLVVGLYLPNSGQRLLTADGNDFVKITSFPAAP